MKSVKLVKNHLMLPVLCKKCGERNYYWLDKTYGCKNGHIIAKIEEPEEEYSPWIYVS